MSWIVVRKDGSMVGTTSDLVSEAKHFESKGEALRAALYWVGSVVAEVKDAGMKYAHEHLTKQECFDSHICETVEVDY